MISLNYKYLGHIVLLLNKDKLTFGHKKYGSLSLHFSDCQFLSNTTLLCCESSLLHLVETQETREAIEAARNQWHIIQDFAWGLERVCEVHGGGMVQAHESDPSHRSTCHPIRPRNSAKLW